MKVLFLALFMTTSLQAFASEIEVKVNGMVCSMCAQGIQKKFSQEKSIKTLKVDMDQKVVHISTLENKDISDDVIKKLITEAGYNVAEIKRK